MASDPPVTGSGSQDAEESVEPVEPAQPGTEPGTEDVADEHEVADSGSEAEVADPAESIESLLGRRPRRRRPSRRIRIVAAVCSVAILAGTAWLGWVWKTQRDNEIAANQALAAAQRFAGILTAFDSSKIDDNFAQTIDASTGEFKDMFVKSSAQLRTTLIENKAAAHGVVVDSAVEWASADTVRVLLFVDQSVSNAGAPEPRLDRSRVKITMQKIDGRWLASKVELP